ncbi:phosphate--AMP phosphotransferase [Anaerosporobacter faecicola]|uniref:phosphate--AMP phosphotransferase n=1 Tax=Anaerosporobacter faecicola TaxID=2718714 RepID=UPI00143C2540|nr:phosphate--AMP phosphotransferase [Anaerosporobacter faecicola]
MLEKVDLNKRIDKKDKKDKKEAKERQEQLSSRLSYLQRVCKEEGIPITILFEGFGASGKGTMINQLIQALDPRGFQVYSIQRPTKEEKQRPYLCRFFSKLPAKGRIAIFDRSWYRRVLNDRIDQIATKEEIECAFDDIVHFEQLLTDDGMVLIKFFLYITKEEQKKRFHKLQARKETRWRVKKRDIRQNQHYEKYLKMNNEMLENTDTQNAPWTIVEAMDFHYAKCKIMKTVVARLEEELLAHKESAKELHHVTRMGNQLETPIVCVNQTELIDDIKTPVLAGIDLTKKLSKEEYKCRIKQLECKLSLLHNEMRSKKVPVILAFEGWDAAGKGGAIKRVTKYLDPRGYKVIPISAPNDVEKAHHYLWRFYQTFPKEGHMAIYDRTWYGRVLVERVEGFCTKAEWKRAYHEINEMEEHLRNFGAEIIKFWMHIDKDEQEKRFLDRQQNPAKSWKITEEDWRNRERWDDYVEAVDEMLVKTSTTYAPWTVIEGNSKRYARVKVLETIIHALEKRLT